MCVRYHVRRNRQQGCDASVRDCKRKGIQNVTVTAAGRIVSHYVRIFVVAFSLNLFSSILTSFQNKSDAKTSPFLTVFDGSCLVYLTFLRAS